MIIQEIFEKVNEPERSELVRFLCSSFWEEFMQLNIQLNGTNMTSLDPEDPNFIVQYRVSQINFRMWQEMYTFVATLKQE